MTERLYYRDPYQRTFEARIVTMGEANGRPAIVLDATAFYPTAGGQPNDTGTLGDARVIDVVLDEQEDLVHVLERPSSALQVGASVRGEIDWERRFDHMQQHTGQHILSQAFIESAGAETVSFHLGEQLSTIDLDRAPLEQTVVRNAVKRANEVVMSSREVTARFVSERELADLPLRKMPVVTGPIRIVKVTDFDWSPCGGTHVQNTGQIGPIQVVRVERRKKQTRIYFVCGWRALYDYEHKHDIVHQLAAHFTTAESQILASVERVEAEAKTLRKDLTAAQFQMLDAEIEQWAAQAEQIGGRTPMRVVHKAFVQRDNAILKEAARRLVERPRTVVLLATEQPRPQFVFACSEDLADQSPGLNMGVLIRTACAVVGGKGGGKQTFAQGGAPEGTPVDQVLERAVQQLVES